MRFLIINTLNFALVPYGEIIDHHLHEITYIGYAEAIAEIPPSLNCLRIIIPQSEKKYSFIAEHLQNASHYHAIIALSEHDLMIAAKLRKEFNIPGKRPPEVDLITDKIKMKLAMRAQDISVPLFINCDELGSIKLDQMPWHSATVLKPINDCGSNGVKIFPTFMAAYKYVTASKLTYSSTKTHFQLEQFITGNIVHFDGIVRNGKILTYMASQYIGNCVNYLQGKPYASIQIPACSDYQKWVQSCLSAAKIKEGIFNLEAFVTPGGLTFLEVAGRIGGAGVNDTFRLATQLNLLEHALYASVVEAIPNYTLNCSLKNLRAESNRQYYGFFLFPGHHLASDYCFVDGLEKIAEDIELFRLNCNFQTKKISQHPTYRLDQVPLSGLIQGNSTKEMTSFVNKLFNSICVKPKTFHI